MASAVDMKVALEDPAVIFGDPKEVVEHPALSMAAKFQILDQWERKVRAVEQNDASGGGGLLRQVRMAMRELDIRSDPKNFPANAASGARARFEV